MACGCDVGSRPVRHARGEPESDPQGDPASARRPPRQVQADAGVCGHAPPDRSGGGRAPGDRGGAPASRSPAAPAARRLRATMPVAMSILLLVAGAEAVIYFAHLLPVP